MCTFNVDDFLATIGKGRIMVEFAKRQTIYAERTPCNAPFYILDGKVKITVLSPHVKEATIAILKEHDFFGDLVDQLFNSSEKRLARVLLLLSHFGKEGVF